MHQIFQRKLIQIWIRIVPGSIKNTLIRNSNLVYHLYVRGYDESVWRIFENPLLTL